MKANELQFESSSECQLSFDKNVYSLAAIKKAAYKFAAEFATNISDKEKIEVKITFNSDIKKEEYPKIVQGFQHEVLDQDLREQIAKETGPIRNVILAEAFSKTALLTEE